MNLIASRGVDPGGPGGALRRQTRSQLSARAISEAIVPATPA